MSENRACPSGRCRVGSSVLAVNMPEGMAYLDPPLPVSAEFIDQVKEAGGDAEGRFRFTEPCIERGCGQWTAAGCGVIDKLVLASVASDTELPACGIRQRCRWFAQRGAAACGVCPYVTTDNRAALAPLDLIV